MSHVELQDCSRYFLKIASQQLFDGGYYGTAVMRALQDVTIFSFLNFSKTMFNVIPWKSLILTDSWLIDSWKALVPCVVTKMLGVINVTSVASWSTPLNSSYQGVKCVVILQWLRHPNIYFSIYLRLYNNLTHFFYLKINIRRLFWLFYRLRISWQVGWIVWQLDGLITPASLQIPGLRKAWSHVALLATWNGALLSLLKDILTRWQNCTWVLTRTGNNGMFGMCVGLLRLVWCPHWLLEHHGLLHGRMGTMVEESRTGRPLRIHGQGQCSLPFCCLSFISTGYTRPIHVGQSSDCHW